MIKTSAIAVVNQKDRAKIQAIVAESPDSPFSYFIFQLQKHIKNVTPNHYMVLGFMIGYQSGAINTHIDFLNNNQPCQRAN